MKPKVHVKGSNEPKEGRVMFRCCSVRNMKPDETVSADRDNDAGAVLDDRLVLV